MKKRRYPIKREFFPYSSFTAPRSPGVIKLAQKWMKVPSYFLHDKQIETKTIPLKGKKGETFTLYLLSPKGKEGPLPCLYFVHGGGFVFPATTSHYKMALSYAKELGIKVAYLDYNLTPKYPFPYPQEEGYAATQYLFSNAESLGIDPTKIGFTGDSAGAMIAVTSCLMAKEKGNPIHPRFLLLIYPWLDNRGDSHSNQVYTDTPMWNSSLSKNTHQYTNPGEVKYPPCMISPCEYEDLSFLPESYIEVAEFDCLHDDGVLFASLLGKEGIEARLYEEKGTMHGYDTKYKSKTMKACFQRRLSYVKEKFAL